MTRSFGRGAAGAAALAVAVLIWIAACYDPHPPVSCGAIPEQSVTVGRSISFDLCFTDANEEMLDHAVSSADPGVATATISGTRVTITAVSPGIAVMTATATDPKGLTAQQTFRVAVPNRPPAPLGRILDLTLEVGDSAAFDVAPFFTEPDGQALSYAAAPADSSRVAASASGSTVTLTALAKGRSAVTVTATDPGGLWASHSFFVEAPNRSPTAADSIAARVVEVDATDTINLAVHFNDPDGDELAYGATASDGAVAALAVAEASLLVTGLAKGSAEVSVTATDDEGLSASQTFGVTVPNRAPEATATLEDRVVFKTVTDTIDLSAFFADPDGDPLAYAAAASGDGGGFTLTVEGASLLVAARATSASSVTVTATDDEGLSAEQTFTVTVPNRAPEASATLADRVVFKNSADTIDLSAFFNDPDGDPLAYEAAASGDDALTLTVSGASLLVAAVARGAASVTVTATDGDGLSAEQTFTVTVPNRAPEASATLADRTVFKNSADTIDLSAFFADPDGDPLAYEAATSDAAVATAAVAVEEASLLLTPRAKGAAEITVTATDDEGLSAAQTFTVTVPNRAPQATAAIDDRTVFKPAADTIDLSAFFADPDDDPLAYAAQVTDSAVAAVQVSEAGALAIAAVGQGEATVTVTATDDEGLSAAQTFTVTVPNRAPAATDPIPPQQTSKRRTLPLDMTRHFADPDGDELAIEAASSNPTVVQAAATGTTLELRTLEEGEATITVTAADPGGLAATQTFAVTVRNRPPAVIAQIPPQTLHAGQSDTLDATLYFADPDGDTLALAPETSNRRTVDVTRKGAGIILWAISKGAADITVTATDPDGLSATQTFPVTVANQGPVPVGRFPDLILNPNQRLTLPIGNYFRDPDSHSLSYAASTADRSVVTASASGSSVTLTAVGEGQTTLTLEATDAEGLSATQTAQVAVGPDSAGPEAVGEVPNQTIAVGSQRPLAIAQYFQDPNGDALTYVATSSNEGAATATVTGATLHLRGAAAGGATVTVTAADPGGLLATQTFGVSVVGAGAGPVAVGSIPSQTVEEDRTVNVSLDDYFQDPDEGAMSFSASSGNSGVATASTSGGSLAVTGASAGSATVTVTATDSDNLSASHAVAVTVLARGQGPVAVGTLPATTVRAGQLTAIGAAAYFRAPEGQTLIYSATTDNAAVSTASASGQSVTVRGVSAGSATLTITASNSSRLTATQTGRITVLASTAGPTKVGAVPAQTIERGDSAKLAMASYFRDPAGGELNYTPGTSSSSVAAVRMKQDTLVINALGQGAATISVVASDSNGRSATQTFSVTVTYTDPGFIIDLAYAAGTPSGLQSAISQAAGTWQTLLSGTELPDVSPNRTYECPVRSYATILITVGTIDDLVIGSAATSIDGANGTLALAGPCASRTGGQPAVGVMLFDSDDIAGLAQEGLLSPVAVHEIAHVLGFGTTSQWLSRLQNPSSSTNPNADTHFTGAGAVAAFNSAGGANYTGGKVPVQNQGANAHWREAVLRNELMTPQLGGLTANPLSAISVAALGDMGYRVNTSLADDFTISLPAPGAQPAQPGVTVDLGDDAAGGPILVIEADGTIRRVMGGAAPVARVGGGPGPVIRIRAGEERR